jgi:hypothetical protein
MAGFALITRMYDCGFMGDVGKSLTLMITLPYMGSNKMTLTEEIIQHVQSLPEPLKVEVRDFVKYLELENKKRAEDADWSALSLFSAIKGIENEDSSYNLGDLKVDIALSSQ